MTNLPEILSHLPPNKIEELEKITQRIVTTDKAEIIILYGSYARGDYKEQRSETKGKKSDYDILVITLDSMSEKELRAELRQIFQDIGVAVHLIVESIDFVNSNLEEMQYFYTDIKREGKILFDSGQCELADSKELSPTRRREIAEEDFKNWFETAESNYKRYQLSVSNISSSRDIMMCSFDLQQVVEMCYTAIEMVFSHYNPYEHNLEVLRDRVLLFDNRLKNVLPYETEEQQDLFDYLNFAYIGGRYRSEKEFPVTKEQLDYWSNETEKLLNLTEMICQERIECLREIEQQSQAKQGRD